MQTAINPIVCEGDIDKIIQRNVNLDADFAKWFLERITGTTYTNIRCNVDCNVPDLGEVDIRAEFRADGRTILAFIENKIDARPTPEQFPRYRKRVEREKAAKYFDHAVSAIIAPQKYLDESCGASDCFDALVSYESIRDALSDEAEKSKLDEGIKKAQTLRLPDPVRISWKVDYFRIAKSVWPDARPSGPSVQPRGRSMTYVVPKPPQFYEFNFTHNVSDIENSRLDEAILATLNLEVDAKHNWDEMNRIVTQNRHPDMHVQSAKDRFGRIYIYTTRNVPHVEISRPANEQSDQIRQCTEIVRELHDWLLSLKDLYLLR